MDNKLYEKLCKWRLDQDPTSVHQILFLLLLISIFFFSHDVEWQKCGQVDQTIINMSVRN